MLKKEIMIDGKSVPFRASATIPRLYRAHFGRDIYKDILLLDTSRKKVAEAEGKEYDIESLEIFENVAFIMAKHADPSQPDTAEEWLEQFNMLSIYTVLPELLKLWNLNIQSTIENKKKFDEVAGK